MQAGELREAFSAFWTERDHQVRSSASLIPHEPSLLFTVAGMVPFMPYFLGEEQPPTSRLCTIQKCVRAGGKHNDLDDIGRTNRHFTFFEMMGNFSFGDYFKAEAIPWAWEFVTEVLRLEEERLWVTVHVSDDEAEEIWTSAVGLPAERIQRLDKDNWWAAGDTGPCGPCSEIFYDLGPEFGEDGGPAEGGQDRFIEVWNLVFMQFSNDGTGELQPLPQTGIDTGAGMERLLAVLQGVPSVWDIDLFAPLLSEAERITGITYGEDPSTDVSMRIFADHARSTALLISDGVFPSNEDRGYVLRRIIRRAVRHAWAMGVEDVVMPGLVEVVAAVMGDHYSELRENLDLIKDVVGREEEQFRRTLATGSQILEEAVSSLAEGESLPGDVAFQLHDTFGFPVEVTEEILNERNLALDKEAFDLAMDEQRERARSARDDGPVVANEVYREILDQFGLTEFVREASSVDDARVLAVVELEGPQVEVFLDRTPFYAESGGQVGDIGTIRTDDGVVAVDDCTFALPGLHRHLGRVVEGSLSSQSSANAAIDDERRSAIRRNHTATHILHWALREVLGDHVKQAGSLVAPDRLRFDFNHFEAVTATQQAEIEDLVNSELLTNGECNHYETTMENAQEVGAIAFFGDKYGDTVRVLEAGAHSLELCGGTHVNALGDIGHLRIISENSVGSNIRRIEAVTGLVTVERLQDSEQLIAEMGELLNSSPEEILEALQRRLGEIKDLRGQVKALQQATAGARASEIADNAQDGIVIERLDGLERDELRDLAAAIRDRPHIEAVVLAGAPDSGGVALVSAVIPEGKFEAALLIEDAAKAIQGGFGRKGNPPLIVAGGKNIEGIEEALDSARRVAGIGGG
ncbi:MAG: alanine--tRNA ligase [Acidimicrobiaceae bacterium]|nr:alanine--tRNA ligase [Acidimicrobiaceae bacterium]|tara:strand:- start:69414 stop:72002 length:2589 start_codon:yes stop_codon:yes gene_type:complete